MIITLQVKMENMDMEDSNAKTTTESCETQELSKFTIWRLVYLGRLENARAFTYSRYL
jgi:hypothetical protein